MTQHIFRANTAKLLRHKLKPFSIFAVMALFCLLGFTLDSDPYALGLGIFFSCVAVLCLTVSFFARPKLIIGEDELSYGKKRFRFDEVVDVCPTKQQYIFSLVTRQRALVKIFYFTDEDKKIIDNLIAEKCKTHLSQKQVRDNIAHLLETSQFEFSVSAKRTSIFFQLYMLFVGFGFVGVLVSACFLASGDLTFAVSATVFATYLTGCITGLVIERKSAKKICSYRDNIFTLSYKGRIKYSFKKNDVQEADIVLNNNFQVTHIIFVLKEKKEKIKISLSPFDRKSVTTITENIKNIFFLHDM